MQSVQDPVNTLARERYFMETTQQTGAIVTGASSGIGLGVTQALLQRGWRVVATSRMISNSRDLKPSPDLVLVDGDAAKRKPLSKWWKQLSSISAVLIC